MGRRIIVGTCLLALTTASAWAESQVQGQPVLGMGATSCAQYLKAARYSDILYHQASNWLLGYISGMSAAMRSSGQASPLDGVNGDQVLRAASDYCNANPTNTIAQAVNVWLAAAPKPAATAPQQAEAKKDDGDWIRLNLTAPARKPLLDRR